MESNDELKKYFNSKEYNTTIIGKSGESKPEVNESKISGLLSLLTDPANKDIREDALISLKKNKGEELLLTAIASPESDGKKHLLVSACWESEINFSKYLPFFILLVCGDDYLVTLEAITTIENMEGPFDPEHLKNGIKKIKDKQKTLTNERAVLLNDLVATLENFLQNSK